MSQHLLVVEDELKIAHLLRDYLVHAGYRVSCLDRGDGVVDFVSAQAPALILLDILLPGLDGMMVCRQVREFSEVPIIMLTAKVEEVDKLQGLDLGADDYICKPFSPREVVARVKAVLRRVNKDSGETRVESGPIVLNPITFEVTVNQMTLGLTPSEFSLLQVLMQNPNRVFSRSELMQRLQGYTFEGYERTIDSHIKNIRKKMSEHLAKQTVIKSVYGVGYKFIMK